MEMCEHTLYIDRTNSRAAESTAAAAASVGVAKIRAHVCWILECASIDDGAERTRTQKSGGTLEYTLAHKQMNVAFEMRTCCLSGLHTHKYLRTRCSLCVCVRDCVCS